MSCDIKLNKINLMSFINFIYLLKLIQCLFLCSTIMSLLLWSLIEIWIDIFGQDAVLEGVGGTIVLRKGIHLNLIAFRPQKVVECSMLPPALALIPILDFRIAHARGHVLCLDAVRHSLHKGVAGVLLHVHRVKWFH